ncbi:PadR family transcriptional regulator [Actinocatenispora thailandica]|uniref:PadR family transcriptional regulator n=1 Tax=Actinocatenispora thailandica TaxID=227318 RepID=UPI001EF358B8|nr:PadR family transcriptional regulator [Actinocatenispora thailandica]
MPGHHAHPAGWPHPAPPGGPFDTPSGPPGPPPPPNAPGGPFDDLDDDGDWPAVSPATGDGQHWRSTADGTPLPPVPPGPPQPPGHGFGGPGFGPPGFPGPGAYGPGFGPGFGPGGPRRAARVRRGDVRAAVLALLAEQPRNGYQLIREIARRSGGVWRPSPGSVYPALSQLADEELVEESGSARRREFALTDAGRTYVDEHPDELAAPFANAAEAASDEPTELWQSLAAVHAAAAQVAHAGTSEAVEAARRVLDRTKRDIYRILAGDADDH